jgi:Mrp family chromosome partitioning ATPase
MSEQRKENTPTYGHRQDAQSPSPESSQAVSGAPQRSHPMPEQPATATASAPKGAGPAAAPAGLVQAVAPTEQRSANVAVGGQATRATQLPAGREVAPPRIMVSRFTLPAKIDPHLSVLQPEATTRAAGFRALRHRLTEQKDPRAILVTSAEDGEGKTSCAANLALALAESGRYKVLLVEANLRRPRLASIFGFQPGRCLLAQLTIHREQIETPWVVTEIQPVGLHALVIAPGGTADAVLHGPTFSASLARWSLVYDYLVLDGPSILTSADASIIQDSVDAVVLVARSGVARNRTVRQALDQLSTDALAGLVLMDSRAY